MICSGFLILKIGVKPGIRFFFFIALISGIFLTLF
jgi:hypothetical protein